MLSHETMDFVTDRIDGHGDAAAVARTLAGSLANLTAAGLAQDFDDEALRELMAALVNVYAAKVDAGHRSPLLAPGADVSATAILVATSALLKASNLEIFELGMWQSWSGSK